MSQPAAGKKKKNKNSVMIYYNLPAIRKTKEDFQENKKGCRTLSQRPLRIKMHCLLYETLSGMQTQWRRPQRAGYLNGSKPLRVPI